MRCGGSPRRGTRGSRLVEGAEAVGRGAGPEVLRATAGGVTVRQVMGTHPRASWLYRRLMFI